MTKFGHFETEGEFLIDLKKGGEVAVSGAGQCTVAAMQITQRCIRPFLRVFACPLILCANLSSAEEAKPQQERPNILFIFSDDHATAAISAYGSRLAEVAPTPNLDRLAKEGALIRRSFCGNSICGPSRASILTGMHSHRNGFLDNENSTFDSNQTAFPDLMRTAGYQTALIGKWHLISHPRGFDHWEILPGQGNYYNPDLQIMPNGKGRRFEGHCTDVVTEHALEWLKDKRDPSKPFVLMCQHKAPHRTWAPATRHLGLFEDISLPEPDTLFDDYEGRPAVLKRNAMSIANHFQWNYDMMFHGENLFPEHFKGNLGSPEYNRMTDGQKKAWDAAYEPRNRKFIADMQAGKLSDKDIVRWKYQRYLKNYLRCVKGVDESVGRLLDYLDTSGLAKNTIVIYASDQGFYLGEHGWYDKRWMFEESLEMPFLIRWPGVVKPGARPAAMIQNIDYAPTFLEVAGASIPTRMQGKSLLPVLKGDITEPDDFRDAIYYCYSGESEHAVPAHDGVRTSRYKLIHFPRTEEWGLFDLEKDPQEMKSLHADPDSRELLAAMKVKYDGVRRDYQVSPSTVPARQKSRPWLERHNGFCKTVRKDAAKCQLVFAGDSITEGWLTKAGDIYKDRFGKFNPLNLGFSGDQTSQLLWRIKNGQWPVDLKPKVAVINIGTNNTGEGQPAAETAAGIRLIVEDIHDKSPDTHIILHPIFARGAGTADPKRQVNNAVNELIAPLGELEYVTLLDLNDRFTHPNGNPKEGLFPDQLHPNRDGYRIWAEALDKQLKQHGLE